MPQCSLEELCTKKEGMRQGWSFLKPHENPQLIYMIDLFWWMVVPAVAHFDADSWSHLTNCWDLPTGVIGSQEETSDCVSVAIDLSRQKPWNRFRGAVALGKGEQNLIFLYNKKNKQNFTQTNSQQAQRERSCNCWKRGLGIQVHNYWVLQRRGGRAQSLLSLAGWGLWPNSFLCKKEWQLSWKLSE